MKMEKVNFDDLNLLLNAKSKEDVVQLCNNCFQKRQLIKVSEEFRNSVAEKMNIKPFQAGKLIEATSELIKNAIFQGSAAPKDIAALFPENFHKDLRDLIGKILIENMQKWKQEASKELVHLPRLVDFDWRVDIKTSSDSLSRMSVPSCILQLQVEEPSDSTRESGQILTENVELSKETLDTMLDGLGKIRDQLGSVANQGQ